MKVDALVISPGRSCPSETSLSEAALLLRNAPGGLLAVAGDHGKLLGVLTGRDFAQALAQAGPSAGGMPVRIFVQPSLARCRSSDEVRDALGTMRTRRVFALPVVDGADLFLGVLTFGDLALAARPERLAGPSDLTDEDLLLALKSMAASRRPLEERAPAPPQLAHL